MRSFGDSLDRSDGLSLAQTDFQDRTGIRERKDRIALTGALAETDMDDSHVRSLRGDGLEGLGTASAAACKSEVSPLDRVDGVLLRAESSPWLLPGDAPRPEHKSAQTAASS